MMLAITATDGSSTAQPRKIDFSRTLTPYNTLLSSGAEYEKHPDVWRDASPTFRVSKGDAPFLIVHGTEDQNVPLAQAQKLFEKLQAAGVPASFVKVDDVHTFRTPEARRQLAVETLAFFNRYLAERQLPGATHERCRHR